jgi:hypothetical protein
MQTMSQQLGEGRCRVALDVILQVDLVHTIYADEKYVLDAAVTVIIVGTHGRGDRSRTKQCGNH